MPSHWQKLTATNRTHRNADNRGQEYEVDVFDSKPRLDRLANPKTYGDRNERDGIRTWIKWHGVFDRTHSLLRDWFASNVIACDDMDADIAGPPY